MARVFAAERRAGVKIVHPEASAVRPLHESVQWAGAVIVAGFGLLFAAGMTVAFTRWLLSLPFLLDFLTVFRGSITCLRVRRSASRAGSVGSISSTRS